MSRIKLGAIAVALSLSTALPADIPYAGGVFGAPAAQAGVWSTVKKVGGKVKGAAKAVGREVKTAAKVAGQTIKHDAPRVGGAIKDGYLKVGKFITRSGDFKGPPLAPNLNRPLPKPPAGRPGSWGGNGRRSETVVVRKPSIARDRTAWGRPAGVGRPQMSGAPVRHASRAPVSRSGGMRR